MKFFSKNLEDTKHLVAHFVKQLQEKPSGSARVVGLYGDLGSSKTTFVQFVAKALGVVEHLTSPTFVILKKYKLKTKNYKLLFHIDAYRLKSAEELRKLKFQELLLNPQNLIFIEWPDHVKEILPRDHIKIFFEFINEETRRITIKDL